jgi:hypothetical protein
MNDDDLRATLRSADPAASLPAADPDRVARLLEDTMTDHPNDYSTDHLTGESRTDGTRHRSRLTWGLTAAVAVIIGGGVLFSTTQGNDDGSMPTAGGAPSSASQSGRSDQAGQSDPSTPATEDAQPARTVTDLTAGGGATTQKCMVPEASPDVVANQTTVFDGTVESISGSTVTLVPTKFYNGEPTDVVVVQAPGPDMEALLSAVTFKEGGRYLVAATDGRVTLCGFSAEYSDSLAAVYGQAFG